jgi:hypothetical protein
MSIVEMTGNWGWSTEVLITSEVVFGINVEVGSSSSGSFFGRSIEGFSFYIECLGAESWKLAR